MAGVWLPAICADGVWGVNHAGRIGGGVRNTGQRLTAGWVLRRWVQAVYGSAASTGVLLVTVEKRLPTGGGRALPGGACRALIPGGGGVGAEVGAISTSMTCQKTDRTLSLPT